MESDKQNWLSHRIRRVEREPVMWDKEKVWDQISEQIGPAPVRWYYFAATVTGLLLLTSYFTLDEPIGSAHQRKSLIDYQSEVIEIGRDTILISESIEMPRSASLNEDGGKVKAAVKVKDILPATTSPVSANEISNDLPEQPIVEQTMEPLALEDHIDEERNPVIDSERISPVVGVIYSGDSPETVVNKRRQKRLYRLEASEADSWSPPLSKNTVILARKK